MRGRVLSRRFAHPFFLSNPLYSVSMHAHPRVDPRAMRCSSVSSRLSPTQGLSVQLSECRYSTLSTGRCLQRNIAPGADEHLLYLAAVNFGESGLHNGTTYRATSRVIGWASAAGSSGSAAVVVKKRKYLQTSEYSLAYARVG